MMPVKLLNDQTIPSPAPVVSRSHKLDFSRFTDPFVQALISGVYSIAFTAQLVIDYLTMLQETAQVVFSRMIYAPPFYPQSKEFKALLTSHEEKVPSLISRISLLEQKFKQDHLVVRDTKEFKRLNDEVEKTFKELNSYLEILEKRKHPLPIQPRLTELRDKYVKLRSDIDDYCTREAKNFLGGFNKAVDWFTKIGLKLPPDIREELVSTWKALEVILDSRINRLGTLDERKAIKGLATDINRKVTPLDIKVAGGQYQGLHEPLRLKNIGQSCYISAVLQLLASVPEICEKLNTPIPPVDPDLNPELKPAPTDPEELKEYKKEVDKYKQEKNDYPHKVAIQQELLQFLNVQQMNRNGEYSQMEFILFLLGGPSVERLRSAIFKSAFHPELQAVEMTKQQDAASLMELFIDQFLPNCKFLQEEHTETKFLPGLEFTSRDEIMTTLQIPLKPPGNDDFAHLIHWVLWKHKEKDSDATDQRTFTPKEGKVINAELAEPILEAAPQKVSEYVQWYRLKELPEVMTFHFKRFIGQANGTYKKDERPVHLPYPLDSSDPTIPGFIDLTRYCDLTNDKVSKDNAFYDITGYIVHTGSYGGGHYTARVKLKDKDGKDVFYECDDLDSKFFKTIDEKVFYKCKDAYIVWAKRTTKRPVTPGARVAAKSAPASTSAPVTKSAAAASPAPAVTPTPAASTSKAASSPTQAAG